MAKVNMKETDYYKSGNHTINVNNALAKATEKNRLYKIQRIDAYNQEPNLCAHCFNLIPYEKKNNKFCCKSCSASYNNVRRSARSIESKLKTSNTMKGVIRPKTQNILNKNYTDIFLIECKVCKKQKYVNYLKKNHKTCGSVDCKTIASVGTRTYQNGSRKPVWFFNPYENKEVLLESSWEVEIAEYLILKNIEWCRPNFIKWVDSNNKTRRYFPDFYLPQYNIYLDPKNPYCMQRDIKKLNAISLMVDIIYGDKDMIKEKLNKF